MLIFLPHCVRIVMNLENCRFARQITVRSLRVARSRKERLDRDLIKQRTINNVRQSRDTSHDIPDSNRMATRTFATVTKKLCEKRIRKLAIRRGRDCVLRLMQHGDRKSRITRHLTRHLMRHSPRNNDTRQLLPAAFSRIFCANEKRYTSATSDRTSELKLKINTAQYLEM